MNPQHTTLNFPRTIPLVQDEWTETAVWACAPSGKIADVCLFPAAEIVQVFGQSLRWATIEPDADGILWSWVSDVGHREPYANSYLSWRLTAT